jgi:hypothetical protein
MALPPGRYFDRAGMGRRAAGVRDVAVVTLDYAEVELRHPIPPQGFQVWCPRLDELEFIF